MTVVNIGTAGALRPGLSGLFEPGTVLNHDISADLIRALGYDPQERLEVGGSAVVLATGDVFVSDPYLGATHSPDVAIVVVSYCSTIAGPSMRSPARSFSRS